MTTFHPRWLCGWRYPRQRPHCSVELITIITVLIISSLSIFSVNNMHTTFPRNAQHRIQPKYIPHLVFTLLSCTGKKTARLHNRAL